jgi:hypothetical protein
MGSMKIRRALKGMPDRENRRFNEFYGATAPEEIRSPLLGLRLIHKIRIEAMH